MDLKPQRLRGLLIDDDSAIVEMVKASLADLEIDILTCTDPVEGIALVRSQRPHIVITDLSMPRMNGLEVLQHTLEIDPQIEVILLTADYSTESAVRAIQQGAADYLTKPADIVALRDRVKRLADEIRRRQGITAIDKALLLNSQFEGIIGRSPGILEVLSHARRVAPHFRTLLITGPSGTGKELLAQAVHRLSPVRERPLITCNCAAIVETLFESEMFGHMRGAFTGALQNKQGLFELADESSIFLDEIGELPLLSQAKLLRVLQNQEFQRVGSTQVRKINVRVIATTNQELEKMVLEGKFREDLFYRLSTVSLRLPSLLERKEDLPLLQSHLVQKYSTAYAKSIHGLTRRVQLLFARHTWPGNIRELENVIAHGCMLAEDTFVDIHDLPRYLQNKEEPRPASPELISLNEVQRKYVLHVLAQVNGNKKEAVRILGISRATLYRMLDTEANR